MKVPDRLPDGFIWTYWDRDYIVGELSYMGDGTHVSLYVVFGAKLARGWCRSVMAARRYARDDKFVRSLLREWRKMYCPMEPLQRENGVRYLGPGGDGRLIRGAVRALARQVGVDLPPECA